MLYLSCSARRFPTHFMFRTFLLFVQSFELYIFVPQETSPGKKRPMSTDLEGFWDMVSIQVISLSLKYPYGIFQL